MADYRVATVQCDPGCKRCEPMNELEIRKIDVLFRSSYQLSSFLQYENEQPFDSSMKTTPLSLT